VIHLEHDMPEAWPRVFEVKYRHSLKPKPTTHRRKDYSHQQPGLACRREMAAVALQAHCGSRDEDYGQGGENISGSHALSHFV
jgi:hypothetical protein